MEILLTYDYELFFGSRVGSVDACMIEPTRRIVELLANHGAHGTFFVDAGYLVRCKELGVDERGHDAVVEQLQRLRKLGHDVELHVHPHWEDTFFREGQWRMEASRYRLADFSRDGAAEIIRRYAGYLEAAAGQAPVAYRAGGWCVQPFEYFGKALYDAGIRIESTLVPGVRSMSRERGFDFRGAPDLPWWRFDDDPMEPVEDGRFIELPITGHEVGPAYFWRIAVTRLLSSRFHRTFGNGTSLPADKTSLLRSLTTRSTVPLSLDGAKAALLTPIRRRAGHEGPLVAIGHPKAQTRASLGDLEELLGADSRDRFLSMRQWWSKRP